VAYKVKDLKDLLEGLPDDMMVVLSSDGEGNSFSPLSGYWDEGYYIPDSTWSGDVRSLEDMEDEHDEDYYDDEDQPEFKLPEDAQKVLVLWPTN